VIAIKGITLTDIRREWYYCWILWYVIYNCSAAVNNKYPYMILYFKSYDVSE